jgi:cytochrome c5
MSNRLATVLTTTLVVLLLASLFVACGAPQEATSVPAQEEKPAPSTLDGKALVEERCTKCHGLGQVERAKKTEEEWKATVERMVAKGAQLSQVEQELVIQYLAEMYPK